MMMMMRRLQGRCRFCRLAINAWLFDARHLPPLYEEGEEQKGAGLAADTDAYFFYTI